MDGKRSSLESSVPKSRNKEQATSIFTEATLVKWLLGLDSKPLSGVGIEGQEVGASDG